MSLLQLEQAHSLTISIVNSAPQEANVAIPLPTTPGPGWVAPGTVNPNINAPMGWTTGVTAPLGAGNLKYSIKNEAGVDILVINTVTSSQPGVTTLSLTSIEGAEVLRLESSPGAQVTKLLLPSGDSLGDLVVETKTKKNKDKESKKPKEKKDKEDKKSSEKKDKVKAPKRQYLLRNPAGQEKMKVSLKSKKKDVKLVMKMKSLERKGEICTVESVVGPSSFQLTFETSSGNAPNEKLYATGAVIGIVDLERSQSIQVT